ncbi:hypothetical protein L7F22_042449 [Adiantum nelumboides]|nr:hypothetical protein [Adiantum nelumboides]
MARCMVKSQDLPHLFWLETTFVLNRCPTKALQSITPYEAWHDRKPTIEHMRVFGYLAYALVPQTQCKKLDDKAVKCIYVGYSAESKGYKLYHPQTKHILVSQDVVFVKDSIQPLVSCSRDSNVSSQDIYDTLLPLFSGGSTEGRNAEPSGGGLFTSLPILLNGNGADKSAKTKGGTT